MTNKEKYIKVFISSFSIKESKLKKDLKYNTIPEWDSVGHMKMIGNLESAFKRKARKDVSYKVPQPNIKYVKKQLKTDKKYS